MLINLGNERVKSFIHAYCIYTSHCYPIFNQFKLFLRISSGIEIMLARSPMGTGFCFGRAENLENYFFIARMASEEFDPNLYFKKCLVCFWLKLSSDFAVVFEENDM